MYLGDPIQLWKKLLFHHKGSNASTEAASRLLQRLGTIKIADFATRSLFIQEYSTIIEYYDETNTAVMHNSMKLMYLRLAAVQDKDLTTLYTAYLSAKRVAGGVVNPNYTPDYAKFFNFIKHHAELLDSTNAHHCSNSTRQTRSQSRGRFPNYCANIADSFHD